MRRSAVFALVLAVAGCEWFRTMADPASIQPHEIEPYPPPAHSVPLGGLPEFTLADAEAVLTEAAPTETSVENGEAYYRDFCVVCHGAAGDGLGPIHELFPAIPAINTDRVAGYSDVYVFALITKGRGLMPEYSRIPAAARWDVVRYMRTLPRGAAAPAPAAATPGGAPAAADTASGGGS